jgi:uncharacterized protein HemX
MTTITNASRQEFSMDLMAEIKELIPLLIMGLTTLGGAVAWMITRMDTKNQAERAFATEERAKLEKLFNEQIETLQAQAEAQNLEISQLRRELNTYVRHVGVLEGLLKAQGIEPPALAIS